MKGLITKEVEPLVADSARLRPLERRAIDLNAIAHQEYRERRARL